MPISTEDSNDEDQTPQGVPVTRANTPDKIRAQLSGGGRDWLLQKPSDYTAFQLRATRTTKIINRKSSKPMTRCTRADGDAVMVFVLTESNRYSSGIPIHPNLALDTNDSEIFRCIKLNNIKRNISMQEFYRGEKPADNYVPYTASLSDATVHITTPKKTAS